MTKHEAMAHDYLNGMLGRDVAAKYGYTHMSFRSIMSRMGVRLSAYEFGRRCTNGGLTSRGYRSYWPECPSHLRSDYKTLQKYYTAAEAKSILEAV